MSTGAQIAWGVAAVAIAVPGGLLLTEMLTGSSMKWVAWLGVFGGTYNGIFAMLRQGWVVMAAAAAATMVIVMSLGYVALVGF